MLSSLIARPLTPSRRPGRNAPCLCGSGRKYKGCCLQQEAASRHPNPTRYSYRTLPSVDATVAFERGTGLQNARRYSEALLSFREALRLHPEYPEAIHNLGVCLAALGENGQAVVCYARSLELWPENALGYSNMGCALQALGRTEEAIESQRISIALDPNCAQAYVNLSTSFYAAKQYEEAVQACARALELLPNFVEVALNGGSALNRLGRFAEAVTLFQNAAKLCPKDPRYHLNLAGALREQGLVAQSVAALEHALEIQPDYAAAYSNLLYTHAFTRDISPVDELQLARGWELAVVPESNRREAEFLRLTPGAFSRRPRYGRCLRLGIVSSELGTHAVAEFIEPFITHLDRSRFHITFFPTAGRFDQVADRLRALADSIVPLIGFTDDSGTEKIRNESIDVLIDTSGHTANNRLGIFARRAAPVQCSYIGYWSTTGLTEMDWFLSDPDAPGNAQAGFSEGLWRLPRIAVAYRGDHSLDHRLWKPSPDATLRLGSFNRLCKIREETLTLWAQVLKAIPHSRLILEDENTHSAETHARIRSSVQQNGIDPSRISFIPYEHGHQRHMLLYNEMDIALDTIPFNSGTTAFDALWMGVPLVTLDGSWIGGRMGGSILRSLGRAEWIASSPAHFVDIVQRLGADFSQLQVLRQGLRAEMAASPLCDGHSMAAALADAFEAMYDRWWGCQSTPGDEAAHCTLPNTFPHK